MVLDANFYQAVTSESFVLSETGNVICVFIQMTLNKSEMFRLFVFLSSQNCSESNDDHFTFAVAFNQTKYVLAACFFQRL